MTSPGPWFLILRTRDRRAPASARALPRKGAHHARTLSAGGEVRTLVGGLGRLDGVYELDDGTLLITDRNAGSRLHWSPKGTETLAKGFKGPADFCVVPEPGGLLVVVPDPAQSELRRVRPAR